MSSALRRFLAVSAPLYAFLAVLSFRAVPVTGGAADIGRAIYAHEYDYLLQWVYVAVALVLSGVWIVSIRGFDAMACDDRTVLLVGALLGGLSLMAFPGVNSNDILAYVAYGRVMGIYVANPWVHPYADFPDEYSACAWYPHPMPYGPVVAPFLAVAGGLSKVGLPLSFYFLKACWLGAHLCSGVIILRIARALSMPARRAAWAFLTCPLLLVELVNNGHCDGLLVLLELLSLDALVRGDDERHEVRALLLAMLAALVKPTALLLLAAEGAYLLRKGRWRALFLAAGGGALACAVLARTLFATVEARAALTNPHLLVNAHSFHSIALHLRHEKYLFVYNEAPYVLARQVITAIFALFCAWRLTHIRTCADVVREMLTMTLGLMLFYSARVWPWYAVWLLPFAQMCEHAPLRRTVEVYCISLWAVYAVPFALLWRSLPWHVVRVTLSSGLPLIWLAFDGWRMQAARRDPRVALSTFSDV